MTRSEHFLLLALLVAAPAAAGPGLHLELDFATDPARQGLRLEGAGAASRIDWDPDDGPWWPGDRKGSLRVHYDADAPGVRALLPLGDVLEGARPFRLEADLVIEHVDASPVEFHQLGFGLSNTVTTGWNRTGTAPLFGDADVYDHVEASYFPNVTAWGGPTLTPSVFGADTGPGDAFSNFAALFGPAADLGDNPPGQLGELEVGRTYRLALVYDPCAATLLLEVSDLSSGEPLLQDTGLTPLELGFLMATAPFRADALTVTSFQDLADFDPSTPAMTAVVRYHRLSLDAHALSARATPRTWKRGRGGDLMLHVEGDAGEVEVVLPGGTLLAERVAGKTWRVGGAAFEALAGPGGRVAIAVRSGCMESTDWIALED